MKFAKDTNFEPTKPRKSYQERGKKVNVVESEKFKSMHSKEVSVVRDARAASRAIVMRKMAVGVQEFSVYSDGYAIAIKYNDNDIDHDPDGQTSWKRLWRCR